MSFRRDGQIVGRPSPLIGDVGICARRNQQPQHLCVPVTHSRVHGRVPPTVGHIYQREEIVIGDAPLAQHRGAVVTIGGARAEQGRPAVSVNRKGVRFVLEEELCALARGGHVQGCKALGVDEGRIRPLFEEDAKDVVVTVAGRNVKGSVAVGVSLVDGETLVACEISFVFFFFLWDEMLICIFIFIFHFVFELDGVGLR